MGTSPAGVHHHNEFVPLGAVSDGQLDLTQGVLAGGRATINTAEYVSVTSREAAAELYSRGRWIAQLVSDERFIKIHIFKKSRW